MRYIYRLTAVLTARYRRDYLCHDSACYLEALRRLYEFAVHNSAVVEHITDIYEAAVEYRLQEIVSIVEMYCALLMSL